MARTRSATRAADKVVDLTLDPDDAEQAQTDEHVLNVIAGNPITEYHVDILQSGGWLNDEIVNAYLHTLQSESILCLSTYFHPRLCKLGPGAEAVQRWLTPCLTEKKHVLIPINLGNTHWALVSFDVVKRELCYYDSMLHRRSGMNILKKYQTAFECFFRVPLDETEDEGVDGITARMSQLEVSASEPIKLRIPEGQPRQHDGSSCGVFVCKWAQVLASGSGEAFTQTQVTRHRKVILDTLLTYKSS